MTEKPKLLARCRACGHIRAVGGTAMYRACPRCRVPAFESQQQLPLYPAGKRPAARAGKPRART